MTFDEMFELSRDPVNVRARKAAEHEAKNVGTMRRLFGNGPEGKICGDCAHLTGDRYKKCALARQSNGPATDWRVRWKACGKFQESQ